MSSQTQPRTLLEAITYFADPLNCFNFMVERRWPTGEITCPTCGGGHLRFDRKRMIWHCNEKHPGRQFSLKVGTIFEDSPIGLDKWLPTVWMIANMKNGVSSHEIARSLGVTQKTAWFMLHRIRLAMQDEDGGKLSGVVEVDETYIGAKARNMHASKRERVLAGHKGGHIGKMAVMGLLERSSDVQPTSKVRLRIVKGAKRRDLMPTVTANVQPLSQVYSDALRSYTTLSEDYFHKVIDHAVKYVDGTVHTNGLENFWSLLKRGIHGTYVNVEPFHLFRYLDEQAFRFNNRTDMNDADRFSVAINNIVGRRLMYKDLIAKADAPNVP
jgi:transposase-like protein